MGIGRARGFRADDDCVMMRSRTSCRCRARRVTSLDHLVGEQLYRVWNREAERLGGLEVDDQLEPRRLYHGQICGLRAVENPAGVGANLPSVAACCSRAAGGASGRIPQCGVGSAMGSMGALGKENAPTSKRMPPSAINTRPGQFSFSPNPAPGIRGSRVYVVLPKIFVVSLR